MKRDMEVVLKILEFLNDRDEISIIETLSIPGYDDDVVASSRPSSALFTTTPGLNIRR
jgi:pyruvate-formate lyase-activating enzyme